MPDIMLSRETADARSGCFIEQSPPCRNIVTSRGPQTGQDKQELVSTLFIYHRGRAYPGFERLTARWPQSTLRSVIERLNRFHEDRANHRSLAYMKEALSRQIGRSDIVAVPVSDLSILSHMKMAEFEQIILLWPDANGMGWSHIERRVFNSKRPGCTVYVFNGRKRLFELSRSLWRTYRRRRFLEKSFLLEMGVLVLFFVTAPILTIWDMMCASRRRQE